MSDHGPYCIWCPEESRTHTLRLVTPPPATVPVPTRGEFYVRDGVVMPILETSSVDSGDPDVRAYEMYIAKEDS